MLKRQIIEPPEYLFPADEWRIVETQFSPEYFRQAETIFALSNGYVGVRGTFDEGRPVLRSGTFVNGFHETWPIHHPEQAFGLATTGQTIVTVPDTTVLQLYVEDEPFYLPVARCRGYRRVLDMREGTLRRELVWSTPAGKHVRITSSRLVSLEHRHLVAISYEVTVLDHAAPVTIASRVVKAGEEEPDADRTQAPPADPRLGKAFDHQVLCEKARHAQENRLVLGYETSNSKMTLGLGVDHLIGTDCQFTTETENETTGDALVIDAVARPGAPIRVTKFVSLHSSRSAPVAEVMARSRRTLNGAKALGYEALVVAQRAHLDRFWARADVEVDDGRPRPQRLQQAVRWNLFQLAQASWRAEGSGIPAKGLTSQSYEGHYFWDTEIYVLPFLAYTQPRIARNLLRFRYSMLDAARRRAVTLSHRGALFPWRTINGEEASAYYQAGTAQYHINADIAYAIRRYVDIRGDKGFLSEVGAEILIETARLWADLGFYDDHGRFRIHGGSPDLQRAWLQVPPAARRGRGVGRGGEEHVRALQRGEEDPPPGRCFPRPGSVGPFCDTGRDVPAPAPLPPACHLPSPGAQASRCRSRHVPPRKRILC